MSYFARLSIFLMLSVGLHLLFFQIEVVRSPEMSVRLQAQGVGFVARSTEQFLSPPAHKPMLSPPPELVGLKSEAPKPPLKTMVEAGFPSIKQTMLVEKKVAAQKVKTQPIESHIAQLAESESVVEAELSLKPAVDISESGTRSESASVPAGDSFETTVKSETSLVSVVESNKPVVESMSIHPGTANTVVVEKNVPEPTIKGTDNSNTDMLAAIDSSAPVMTSSPDLKYFVSARPRYDLNPPPNYPEAARRRGQQGTVWFEVLVLANGQVGEIRLSQTSGYKSLDRAALKAVRFWQFRPALSYGAPVESRVAVPVGFVSSK